MGRYASQNQPEVPPEREGYVRYVLTEASQVPHGAPVISERHDDEGKPFKVYASVSNRFHSAGDIVSVHKDFPAAKSWRPYEPPKET